MEDPSEVPLRKTIHWQNTLVHDHKKLIERKNHLIKLIPSYLPLLSNDKNKLQAYADQLGVTFEELASFRNNLKIQQEIYASNNADQIKTKLNSFVKTLHKILLSNSKNKIPSEQKVKAVIAKQIRETKFSLANILKLIRKSPYYSTLPDYVETYLANYDRLLKNDNTARAERAHQFEVQLENYLKKNNIGFQTEKQLLDVGATITPDILLDEPIEIIIKKESPDSKEKILESRHIVKWLDAKNFMLADIPFMITSLKKQGKKYVDAYGPGAFVFRYGFDSSLVAKFNLENILILDGNSIIG
jgi:hypothetical protein